MLQHQHFLWTFFVLWDYLSQPWDYVIVALFSVLPDIDITPKKFQFLPKVLRDPLNLITSLIWKIFYLPYVMVAGWFIGEKALEHRTITHALWPALMLSAIIYWFYPQGGLLAFASYVLHLYFDSITKSGVRWLYPWLYIRGRLNTSSWWQRFIPDVVLAGALYLQTPAWLPLLLFALLIKEVRLS
ncbi:MAG: metal-dependent hydrolase [Candidatus Micrarchaeota archaeon]|nr:metal-dependent hydrolase [Candidatus Micrarchaeota archaeon]